MQKILLTLGVILLTVSCSSVEKVANSQKDSAPQKVVKKEDAVASNDIGWRCEAVKGTGSRIKKKQCSTAAQRAERKREAEIFKRQNDSHRQTDTMREVNQIGN